MTGPDILVTIERRVRESWSNLYNELQKMKGDARPSQAADIFVSAPTDQGIEVEVRPVVFRILEKAAADQKNIFVVVKGSILFSPLSTRHDLRASGFATKVGYFREVTGTRLKHVYGIHYDFDDKLPAHPVYHCQMSSMAGFVEHINERYYTKFAPVEDNDNHVMRLLRNVRIPTAHMDAFSVFLQILGDHLVSDKNDDGRKAFLRAQGALSTVRSLPAAAARLDAVLEQKCFRSNHWYRDTKHQAG